MKPLINCLATGKNSTITGTIINIEPAKRGPHSIYCSAVRVASPRVTVLLLLLNSRIEANIYSPQAITNEYTATVTIPGAANGKVIFKKNIHLAGPVN